MPTLRHLGTMQPPCTSRTWSSTPHPHLPILATACSDKTARIYSLQNFRQQSVVSGGHKRSIRRCAWKPNSKGESVLATGSFDASAGIWRRWEAGAGEPREVDMTGHSNGNADGDEEDEDEEWRFAVILDGHDSEIKSLAFCPTAPLLATCSRDKSVWIWEELDDDNFETVAVLQEHEGDVKTVVWHPTEALLASGSYDDEIRLWREDVDDWACCARLTGHDGTVWWVEFEDANNIYSLSGESTIDEEQTPASESQPPLSDVQRAYVNLRLQAGPRLMSCSDDTTIRVWRRVPKEGAANKTSAGSSGPVVPSIWKNDIEEQWIEETRLPVAHERPIYAVSWSRTSGRVVSAGSDGKLVVYAETWKDVDDAGTTEQSSQAPTQWNVVAEIDNAHDVFEVNHVAWAPRADKGKRTDDEEVIVTTGDDGEVKVWVLDP